MKQGTIFNIQRYSLHDGPGIRTIIFLKGCPLKCAWCSNPESQPLRKQVGFKPDLCIGCGKCREAKRCVFDDDPVNEAIEKARACDGFIFGSPVYYASPNGAALAFLDRLFYAGGSALRYKPGAAVVSARRGGTTAALDALNKYFTINCMPVVSSKYWNMVHGNTPDEVRHDLEGMQVMRTLGRNMAWLLKCIEIGRAAGITTPEPEPPVRTNFIR